MVNKGVFLTVVVLLSLTAGCDNRGSIVPHGSGSMIETIPARSAEVLSNKKIFFGHQSVGENILDGIRAMQNANGYTKLYIKETGDPDDFNQPILAHAAIGKNGDPYGKIGDFVRMLEKGIGDKTDIALFKFCFWDIREETDVQKVFDHYTRAVITLQRKYPKMRFIHTTVPLMAYPSGMRARLKRWLGYPVAFDLDNIKRNELNKLIGEKYAGREPIFDIASAESTLPDGSRATFAHNGKTYFYLASEYTSDGGHLNEYSRKRVAEQMLDVLASVANDASS